MSKVVDNYLNEMFLLEDVAYISEDIASFMKKFKPEALTGFKDDLQKAVKKKDPEKIGKIVKKVRPPSVHIDKIVKVGERMSSDFKNNYNLAKRVVDNSLPKDVGDNYKQAAAFYLSAKQQITKKMDFKTSIRKFVDLIRYLADAAMKVAKEVPSSTIVEGVIGWILIILFAALMLTAFLTAGFWMTLTLLACVYVLVHLFKSDSDWLVKASTAWSGILTRQGSAYVTGPGYDSKTGPELF